MRSIWTGLSRRKWRLLPATVVVLIGATGIAVASIPSSGSGVINGCYRSHAGLLGGIADPHSQGELRVIDAQSGQHCASDETALNFNQTGPPGPKGDTGAKGDKGDPCLPSTPGCVGPKGDPGATGAKGAQGDPCLPSNPACVGPAGAKGDPGPQGPACDPSNPACVGPPGPPGAQGPQGNAGAPGPSDLYAQNADHGPDLHNFQLTDEISLDVPAGNYLVTGRINIGSLDTASQYAECRLNTDAAGIQDKQRLGGQPNLNPTSSDFGYDGSFKLQDAERFTSPTRITIQCDSYNAITAYLRLAAIKVGTLQ